MGRAGPVGEAAPPTLELPHRGFEADPSPLYPKSRPASQNSHTDNSGRGPGPDLKAGPGLAPCSATVLLHHGAYPTAAAAPEGHTGSGSAHIAQVAS